MLASQKSIESFFKDNNISLSEERKLSHEEVVSLLLKAKDLGYGFLCFVHFSVINGDANGIVTNFSSWEEVYDFYTVFMIGFNKRQSN